MGLILTGAILVAFYIAKIFFPEWIVGVAEIPSIVKFGNFVDSHLWAFYTFNILFGCFIAYIYCCACLRSYRLNVKSIVVLLSSTTILQLVSMFMPQHYAPINYVNLVISPFLICLVNKSVSVKTFISTVVCFSIDILSQVLSFEIRNLMLMSTRVNTATYTILLIDMVIWRFLLYMFFNYKNKKGV
jgi:hypothetical protein